MSAERPPSSSSPTTNGCTSACPLTIQGCATSPVSSPGRNLSHTLMSISMVNLNPARSAAVRPAPGRAADSAVGCFAGEAARGGLGGSCGADIHRHAGGLPRRRRWPGRGEVRCSGPCNLRGGTGSRSRRTQRVAGAGAGRPPVVDFGGEAACGRRRARRGGAGGAPAGAGAAPRRVELLRRVAQLPVPVHPRWVRRDVWRRDQGYCS